MKVCAKISTLTLIPAIKSAEHKFKEINEAYSVFKDEKKRADYIRSLANLLLKQGGQWYEGARAPISARPLILADSEMFFSDIFGADRRHGQSARKGADMSTAIELSLEDAFTGVTRPVAITRETPCRICNGTGAESYQTCDRCKGSGKLQVSKGFFRMS